MLTQVRRISVNFLSGWSLDTSSLGASSRSFTSVRPLSLHPFRPTVTLLVLAFSLMQPSRGGRGEVCPGAKADFVVKYSVVSYFVVLYLI